MKVIKTITGLAGVIVLMLAMVLFSACNADDVKKADDGTDTDDIGNISVNIIYADDTEANIEVDCPWDEDGAKQPSEYTWKEFEALSGPQQIAFQNHFESTEEFDAWMQKAEYEDQNGVNPWDEPGAKQPSEYTWEEFEALSGPQQIQFQYSFDSFDDFEVWLNANEKN